MNIYVPIPGETLPVYDAARDRIEQLVAVDPANVGDVETLAEHLSGVAPALGSVSISHGTIFMGNNLGILHEFADNGQPRRFSVSHDNVFPASMREAGIYDPPKSNDVYYVEAEVPSDDDLRRILAQDRQTWHRGNSDSRLYVARHNTAEGQYTQYSPFRIDTETVEPGEVCLPRSPRPYFETVQRLSHRLLEVTADMPRTPAWTPDAGWTPAPTA
jgi:hypothetical protein